MSDPNVPSQKDRLSAGGAAASSGIRFQAHVGALFAAYMLAEQRLDEYFQLGAVGVNWIRFETEAPVDDILVATSNDGFIAIQAKTSVSGSFDLSGPLGKTVEQFVRYWLECREGNGDRGWNRPLDSARDRLVLAFAKAPASIETFLPEALTRRASVGGGAFTKQELAALEGFDACIRAAWNAATSSPWDEQILADFATLVQFRSFNFDGVDRVAAKMVLAAQSAPGEDGAPLFDAVVLRCLDLMKKRGGTDQSTLRRALASAGVALRDVPRFHRDIEKLREYSARTANVLRRYEYVSTSPGNGTTVERECQDDVFEATKSGSLLIIGEPGSGKSSVLNVLARRLGVDGADVVELAVDELSVESIEGLSRALGLEQDLLRVLEAWDAEKPGWLVIDALDATRGNSSEDVFRKLIRSVVGMSSRWRVVASIRTFDLKLGQEYRTLFEGVPPVPALADPEFASVRHVRVPRWSSSDFQQLKNKEFLLDQILLDAPEKLIELASVPFNTRLICDLLAAGNLRASLNQVTSQVQLLMLYWQHRIETHGASGRAVISRTVKSMVRARALRARFEDVVQADGATVDALVRDGVLVAIDGGRAYQFRHHILFDFATASVFLDPADIEAGRQRFPKSEAQGLLLAPGLGLVLQELWEVDGTRARFWNAVCKVAADSAGDPILRSSASRAGAELPVVGQDTNFLVSGVAQREDFLRAGIRFVCGALAVRLDDTQPIVFEPWCALTEGLSPYVQEVPAELRFLLHLLIGRVQGDGRVGLGVAARALLSYALMDDAHESYAVAAIQFVAGTFETDVAASERLLWTLLGEKRMESHSWSDLPALSREISSFADHAPDFVVALYERVFSHEVRDSRTTRIGNSQILALTSTAAQDYDMVRYSLTEYFDTFVERHPNKAALALTHAVDGLIERKHRHLASTSVHEVKAADRTLTFREDLSVIWASDPETTYGYDADELVVRMLRRLRAVPEQDAVTIMEALLSIATAAILWSRLFMVAAERGGRLLERAWPIASQEAFLVSPDTRKDAIDVVVRAWPGLSSVQQASFEQAVFDFDFSRFDQPTDARDAFLRRLFRSIGEEQLSTEHARSFSTAPDGDPPLSNDRLMRYSVRTGAVSPYDHIAGLDREDPASAACIAAVEAVEKGVGLESESDVEVTRSRSIELLEALHRSAAANIPDGLKRLAEGLVAQGSLRMLSKDAFRSDGNSTEDIGEIERFTSLLTSIAASRYPIVVADTEKDFERSPSWGAPAARVDAAEAVVKLASQSPWLYTRLSPLIDELLADGHPAVRMQAGLALVALWQVDRSGFWASLGRRAEIETNMTVLEHISAGVLARVLHADPDRSMGVLDLLVRRLDEHPSLAGKVRVTLADQFAVLWVSQRQTRALEHLRTWIRSPADFVDELNRALFSMRSAYVLGLSENDSDEASIRRRAVDLTYEIVDAASRSIPTFSPAGPADEDAIARAKACLQVIDSACSQFYFALKEDAGGAGQKERLSATEIAAFVTQTQRVLLRIGDRASAHTVHYLLQLVGEVMPSCPAVAFDLTAHALRKGGAESRFEADPIALDQFVVLIGRFLADHKELFRTGQRQAQLVECLELFFEAGWPETRRLLYRLPELIQ